MVSKISLPIWEPGVLRIKVGVGDKPPEWIWQIMYSAVFSKEDREKMEQAFKDAGRGSGSHDRRGTRCGYEPV